MERRLGITQAGQLSCAKLVETCKTFSSSIKEFVHVVGCKTNEPVTYCHVSTRVTVDSESVKQVRSKYKVFYHAQLIFFGNRDHLTTRGSVNRDHLTNFKVRKTKLEVHGMAWVVHFNIIIVLIFKLTVKSSLISMAFSFLFEHPLIYIIYWRA